MVMTMDSGYGGTNGLGFCFANHDRIRQARAALPAGKELWVDGAMDETEMKNCFALGVDAVIAGRMISRKSWPRPARPAGPICPVSGSSPRRSCWSSIPAAIVWMNRRDAICTKKKDAP